MSKSVSTSTDKIIVDRSRTRRNKAVFDTVRTTRERLQYGQAGINVFERDMFGMHITSTLQGAALMPLFIVVATVIGIYISSEIHILGWSARAVHMNTGKIILTSLPSGIC